MRRNIGVLSLGCPRNVVDTEVIVSRLKKKNYQIVDIDKAKIALVNTCAFIKEAVEESCTVIRQLIDLKREGKIKKIIVYGCLVERYKNKLLRYLKDVDALVGRISINGVLRNCFITPHYFAYLKICEGCLNACSFCTIPKIKGNFESRTPQSIIKEVRFLDKKGIKELNIVGQDISLYGKDISKDINLTSLLKEILKNTSQIRWIRLLYLYPHNISDELLGLINKEERICKYIDLPLQHINNRILKLMNRKITKEEIIELIKKIRKTIPSVFIRTTLMVGFPTETDKEFEELIDFVKEFKFERLGAFIYSRETQTPAYDFKPQIPFSVKKKRFGQLMQVQQEISRKINERFLGKTVDILIEESQNSHYLGRTVYDAPEVDGAVWVKSNHPLKIGDIQKVKIVDTLEYDLVGEAI